MRVETKLFLYLFVFFVPVTLIYGFWSEWKEPIGVTALVLTARSVRCSAGFYFWMTGKKLPLRPEDNASGEIAEAEGNYGYFVASSWTPLWLAGSGAIMFAGLAIGWWLFIIGAFVRSRRRVPLGVRVLLGRVLHLTTETARRGRMVVLPLRQLMACHGPSGSRCDRAGENISGHLRPIDWLVLRR